MWFYVPAPTFEEQLATLQAQSSRGLLPSYSPPPAAICPKADKKKETAAICRHFTNGTCRWGPNCKFPHVDVNDAVQMDVFRSRNLLNPSTTTCRHFMNGNCHMGTSCRFVHPATEPVKLEEKSPLNPDTKVPLRLCRYFLDGKACPFGVRCEYLHNVELCHTVPARRTAMDMALKEGYEEAIHGALMEQAMRAQALGALGGMQEKKEAAAKEQETTASPAVSIINPSAPVMPTLHNLLKSMLPEATVTLEK